MKAGFLCGNPNQNGCAATLADTVLCPQVPASISSNDAVLARACTWVQRRQQHVPWPAYVSTLLTHDKAYNNIDRDGMALQPT